MDMKLKHQNIQKHLLHQNMIQNIQKHHLHQNIHKNIHHKNIQKHHLNQNILKNIQKPLLHQNIHLLLIRQNIHKLLLLMDPVEKLMLQKQLNLIYLHPPLKDVRIPHLLQPLLHHNALKVKIASNHATLSSRNLEENVIQFQERNTTQTNSTTLLRLNEYC
jgi:hypothetical protein